MTGDERYTRYYEEAVREGEENAMCYVLDGIEEYGRSQGRTEGREEGRKEQQREIITRFIKSGTIDMETIAEGVGVSVEVVKEIAEEM